MDATNLTSLTVTLPWDHGTTYYYYSTLYSSLGALSDTANDDQAEYSNGESTITARFGTGANAKTGGSIGIGSSDFLQFDIGSNSLKYSNMASFKVVATGKSGGGQQIVYYDLISKRESE